jgi:Domain of unknown function (DUF4390)
MRNRKWLKILAALLCMSFVIQTEAFANIFKKDARITNMTVVNNHEELLLSLKVEGAFKKKLEEAILSGAPTTFSFFIIISKYRAILPDKKVLQINLTNTIKYDNLKNEFTVKQSWEDNKPLTTDSFGQAKQWMTEINNLKLIPLSYLQKGDQYKIKAKAQLDKVTLPLFLNYIFFFFESLWNFETDWQTIKFTY